MVCPLNGDDLIQLTPLASEKAGSQVYVVKAGHWDFLLGKQTKSRRKT